MEMRRVERLKSGLWEDIKMSDLKPGDTFRLTDIVDEGPFGTFVAESEPYIDDNGICGIHCAELK